MSNISMWAHRLAVDEEDGDLNFYGEFPTKNLAIESAKRDHPGKKVQVGRICHPMDLVSANVDYLLENLECEFADHVGSDCSSVRLAADKREELALILDKFLREHAEFEVNGLSEVETICP